MSDYSVFTKRENKNVKLSTSQEIENKSEESGVISNFVSKIKGYVKLSSTDEEASKKAAEENLGFCGRMKKSMIDCVEVEKSYKNFIIILAVGLALIFLSLMFIPIAWLKPEKFVSLFALGCLVTLISFIFIYGTVEYFRMLFSKERFLFTLLFLSSIFVGLYFAFTGTNYFISVICSVIQIITLIVFTLSFIPGGRTGISFLGSMLMSPVYGIWNRIKGSS
jgi:hypothetical protein